MSTSDTSSSISTLIDELIISVSQISDKNSHRLKSLRNRADETLKASAHIRTDQFAVAKRLEGLQEKFQVVGKDDLAAAVRARLDELNEHRRDAWFPEILSLLLELSDRPAQLSEADVADKFVESHEDKALTWSELDVANSAYCDDGIWETVNFNADSSDDDELSTGSSDVFIPRIIPQSGVEAGDEYVIPEDVFSADEDEALITSIKSAQFWKDENHLVVQQSEEDYSRHITELQLLRETIFMLEGLPTSIFWRLDGKVEVDRRYALSHASNDALSSLLRTFSILGAEVDALRRYIRVPQDVPHMQTFVREVENRLHDFDGFLSRIQSQHLSAKSTTTVSLLNILEEVREQSRLVIVLSNFVSQLSQDKATSPAECLNLLYDFTSMTQATGENDEFLFLARLFFSCLETYSRPIRLWVQNGTLDTAEDSFFIAERSEHGDLRSLWHDWYEVRADSQSLCSPEFLRPLIQRIFTAGKSMVFLRCLNVQIGDLEGHAADFPAMDEMFPEQGTSAPLICLPFHEIVRTALTKLVDVHLGEASKLLRQHLDEQCGLWTSLQALELIYLGKDMSLTGAIDTKIFELIDRGNRGWNDRFLLTDLAQNAFSAVSFIDPSRVIVRSRKPPSRDTNNGNRSVSMLKAISIDYVLPWPVANVITKEALSAYQRISTFLMQIRRARHAIAKQRLRAEGITIAPSETITQNRTDALGYCLRHHLLWFLDTLYGHITDFVISAASDTLNKTLADASDVDAMIAIHRAYIASLEDQCLLSKSLEPIHQAAIALLDLCIHFTDIQIARYSDNSLDHSHHPRTRPLPKRRRIVKRMTRVERDPEHEDGDEAFDEDDDGPSEDDVGNTTSISFAEAPYAHRIRKLKQEFDRLVPFIAAGLRSVGRVEGQLSWEILAEKLEWRQERKMF